MDGIPNWLRRFFAFLQYPVRSTVNLIAILITLASGFSGVASLLLESRDDVQLVQSLTLSIILLFLIATLVWREASVVRRRRVASSLKKQAEASDRLQTIWSVLRGNTDGGRNLDISRSIIEEVLSQYSEIFGSISQSRCRFCVKLIERLDEEHYVYTLARDKISARENRHSDKDRNDRKLDFLKSNSDFVRLWSPDHADEGFFISDDLKKEKGYSSTSQNYRKEEIFGDPNSTSNRWVLAYRSTIVWPIRQEKNSNLPGLAQDRCIGFLAVDSPRVGAFRKEDAAIGEMLARTLYPVLEIFAEVDQKVSNTLAVQEAGNSNGQTD